jgi:molecular chaperone DnaK
MAEDRDTLLESLKGELIVGIDLGTTNSGVSVWDPKEERAVMLPGPDGEDLTPSVVGWDRQDEKWVVGRAARDLGLACPGDVAYSIKRYIGRLYTDSNVFYGRQDLTFDLVSGGGRDQLEDVVVDFGPDEAEGRRRLSAPDISAKVLAKLREDAVWSLVHTRPHIAEALGRDPRQLKHAVITVPAYFDVLQRRATVLAGTRAGLEVVDILNEPTAAALAHRGDVLSEREKYILVCDLGGGTYDVSLLKAWRDRRGYAFYAEVVDGDTRLGGDDIDKRVARWLAEQIEEKHGDPVRPEDDVTREQLRRAAERAKVALTTESKVPVPLVGLDLGSRPPYDTEFVLSREELEKRAAPELEKTWTITRRVVEDVAGMSWDQIDEVVLVGGQTLMPAFQRYLDRPAGRKLWINEQPQLDVALGAGEYAHILSQGASRFHQNTLVNVVALPLGIRLDDQVDPEVTVPHFWPMIEANVSVPQDSEAFRVKNLRDNEKLIRVQVLQGPRGATAKTPLKECTVLGSVDIEVLPKPAGTYKFDILFHVKENGILEVNVTDPATGETRTHDIMKNQVLIWRHRAGEKEEEGS